MSARSADIIFPLDARDIIEKEKFLFLRARRASVSSADIFPLDARDIIEKEKFLFLRARRASVSSADIFPLDARAHNKSILLN